jgi:hypothetical protein
MRLVLAGCWTLGLESPSASPILERIRPGGKHQPRLRYHPPHRTRSGRTPGREAEDVRHLFKTRVQPDAITI